MNALGTVLTELAVIVGAVLLIPVFGVVLGLVVAFGGALLWLLPLALGLGAGAELQRPLALAVIGGLALSTPVTLLAIPGLYAAITRGRQPRRLNP